MTKTTVDVPKEVWEQFNHQVLKEYGKIRGARNKALTEAIQLWLKKKATKNA
jgi:hypothetical protein